MAAIGPRSETFRFRSADGLVGRKLTAVAQQAADAYRKSHAIASPRAPYKQGAFYAVLVNEGPGAESDYADARYWVRSVRITNTSADDRQAKTTVEDIPDGAAGYIYDVATNLAEVIENTHVMPVRVSSAGGTIVQVYPRPDVDGVTRYVFSAAAGGATYVRVKLAGGSPGGVASAPSYVYDCYPLSEVDVNAPAGPPLYEDVIVLHNRRSPIRVLPAEDGSIALLLVDPLAGEAALYAPCEQIDINPCNTGGA